MNNRVFCIVALLAILGCGGAFSDEFMQFEHDSSAGSRVFSPDGQWVASASSDGQPKIWSPFSGAQRCALWIGAAPRLAFCDDGTRIIAGNTSNAKVLDAKTGKVVFPLWNQYTTQVAVSPIAKQVLLTSLMQHKAAVFSLVDGSTLFTLPAGTFGRSAYSPDGKAFAFGYKIANQGVVIIWNAETFEEIRRIDVVANSEPSVLYTRSGGRLLVFAREGDATVLRMYDSATGDEMGRIDNVGVPYLSSYELSRDDGRIALWKDPRGAANLWDLDTKTQVGSFRAPVSYTPDGRYLFTGESDTSFVMRDAATLEVIRRYDVPATTRGGFVFSPDGTMMVIDSGGNTLHAYYIGEGQPPALTADLINDPIHGEGPLLVNGMTCMSPTVQALFEDLGWESWADVDMEGFDKYEAEPGAAPGDGIPDSYQLALVQYVLDHPGLPNHALVAEQFAANKAMFREDMDALALVSSGDWAGMKSYDELLAAMLGFSAEMQASVNAFMMAASGGASGLPHLAEYHVFGLSGEKTAQEPFSAAGDCDNDNAANIDEYTAVMEAGGSPSAFAEAASSPYNMWAGNPAMPVAAPAGLVLLGAALAAAALRRTR